MRTIRRTLLVFSLAVAVAAHAAHNPALPNWG